MNRPWEVIEPNGLLGYRNQETGDIRWLMLGSGATRAQAERIVDILNEDYERRATRMKKDG